MDKKRSILNVSVSIAFKIIILIGQLLVRRFLIRYIGSEVNGLNSLYQNIIGVLSVAELGVGSAITFCMYRPIVDGDNDKVSALYHLFTKLYLIIGALITVGGIIVMPLLPYLAKDSQNVDVNLYFTFGLFLASVIISYLFSSKTSLINAYKNNYITTTINSLGLVFQYALQIFVIIYTKSFEWYLIFHIVAVLLQWAVTEVLARYKYKDIIKNRQRVDTETKHLVVKNVKAMFMHKIGNMFVNTADVIIISAFIGLKMNSDYGNYTVIMTSMTGLISLFFTPLTSVIGHMYVESSKDEVKKYYNFFYAFNFILGSLFFLGYYAIIDDLVCLCFNADLLAKTVSFVITLNYFIQFMRKATELFKDSTGTFYYDRWKPLVEGVVNIVLSILFVLWFGVTGVIVATIITNLLICHIVEPHVLHKYALQCPAKNYYIKNYLYIALFTVMLLALNFCLQSYASKWIELLVNGFIAVGLSVVPISIALVTNKDFRHYFKDILRKIKAKFHKDKEVN